MTEVPDVSIIIVNYNSSKVLSGCLESIISMTKGLYYEVIIIDNDSEPDLEERLISLIPEICYQSFKFIYLKENIGFGKACNVGLEMAKGRNVLFLNPDIILLGNSIKILSDFLDSHPEAGACGGNLYDKDRKPEFSYLSFLPGFFTEFNELLHLIPEKLIFGRSSRHNYNQEAKEVKFSSGADLMVKKNVIEKTGGFSDRFFMYYEDTDLCKRIIESGKKIYNVPSAKFIHLVSHSVSGCPEGEERKIRWIEGSRKIYYNRNLDSFKGSLANFFYLLFLISRKRFSREKARQEYYRKRLKYFRG